MDKLTTGHKQPGNEHASGEYNAMYDRINWLLDQVELLKNPPISLTATVAQSPATTFGGSNGSVTVTASGGTAPYTYSKDGVAYQSSNILTGYTSGSKTVYIKDAANTVISRTITVMEAAPVLAGPLMINTTTKEAAFDVHSSFTSVSDYEYNLAGGTSYTTMSGANAFIQDGTLFFALPDGTYAANAIRIRIKSGSTYAASNYISNSSQVVIEAAAPTYDTNVIHGETKFGVSLNAAAGLVFHFNQKTPDPQNNTANTMYLSIGGTIQGAVAFNGVYDSSDIWKVVFEGNTYTGTGFVNDTKILT